MNDSIGDNAAKDVVSIIERIEWLEDEKKQIASDISDVYKESKGRGYDATALKEIIKIRREDPDKREARESMVDVYMRAINRWEDTPLAQATKKD
jgi:uncharacterized protein (UPF0335 family)